MISTVLAAMLVAAPSPAVINNARGDYSACLHAFMKSSLQGKMEPAAFETALAPACEAKAQALRAAIIAADTKIGIKRADAEEGAGLEIQELQANTKEYFGIYHRNKSMPER